MSKGTESLASDHDATPDVVRNVEESLRRADFMFYSAKRWDEDRYLAEVARPIAIRDELAQAVAPSRPLLGLHGGARGLGTVVTL